MEQLIFEERLKDISFSAWRRLRRGLSAVLKYLEGSFREDRLTVPRGTQEGTRSSSKRLQQGKIIPDLVRVVQHWNRGSEGWGHLCPLRYSNASGL